MTGIMKMISLMMGLIGIILILSIAYLIKRVNRLVDYVLGKDNSLINLGVPNTSYTELPDYLYVLSVFSKPIHDRLIIGVYSSSDKAKERLNYYKKSFRHPENYIDYRIDSIPNNLEEDK